MTSDAKVEEILARYPGPVMLRPSRRKWLLVLLGGAIFTAGGIWMVQDSADGGWFVLTFFGLVTIAAAVMLLPGAGGLTLDAEGFGWTSLFRPHRTRWQDASDFAAARMYQTQGVFYEDAAYKSTGLGQISRSIAGRSAGLPDTYGLSASSLADLMTRWRARALASSRPT